jgi:hypothetical protein
MQFKDLILCYLTEARMNVKLFPAIRLYGKIFYDKQRLGHFNIFSQIYNDFFPKKFGKNLTDAQEDVMFERGNPVEGFVYFDSNNKPHFFNRDESKKRFGIDVSEQL